MLKMYQRKHFLISLLILKVKEILIKNTTNVFIINKDRKVFDRPNFERDIMHNRDSKICLVVGTFTLSDVYDIFFKIQAY